MTAELFYWSLFALAVGVGMWGAVKQHGHTSIEDGGTLSLSSSSLADSAVTTAKLADSSVTGAKTLLPLFQCRLEYSSTTLLTLNRFGGSWLFINGLNYQIPSSAPTLNVSGASASQLNYIYAYISGGAVTLEKSTTAYATDSTYGHLIKSGDATRTLVGLARTTGSTIWADSVTQRFTRSYYNDPGIAGVNNYTTDRSTTSTTFAELNSEIRVEFLSWTGEIVMATFGGHFRSDSAVNTSVFIAIGFDGTTAEDGGVGFFWTITDSENSTAARATTYKSGLTEGYHYATGLARGPSGRQASAPFHDGAGNRWSLQLYGRR